MAKQYVLGSPQPSFWNWLTQFSITNQFNGKSETGIDLNTPFHTPITSLTSGVVTGVGYYAGGGVVSVESIVNGLPAEVYYQHLDTINVTKGAQVQPGTPLGLSGGQLSGGAHPSTSQYSTGPHTEVGINAPFGLMWNPLHINNNYNPLPWLQGLASGFTSAGNTAGSVTSDAISQGISGAFTNIGASLTGSLGLKNLGDFFWRSLLILGGMTLIVIGLLVFFSKQEAQVGGAVVEQVGNAAKAGATAAAA